jgi:hypothetical protein
MCRTAFVIVSLASMYFGMETLLYGQAEYFPLAQGDTWIYACSGSCGSQATVTVLVGPTMNVKGITYSQLQGWFGGNYWVREDSDGNVWEYDTNLQRESLWYAFGRSAGGVYSESIPSACCGQATLQSARSAYQGPVGNYDTALEITYPGVSNTGISREFFLPYTGLVSRTALTGGSSAKYDLIYSRLSGVTFLSRPELSTGLALDHAVYSLANSAGLTARLSILNSTSDPVSLRFSTSQKYDLEILDDKGKSVYQWSKGRAFAQVVTTVSFQNETDYVITVPLAGIAPGNYVARGWLTAAGPPLAYSASASFQVK